MALDSKRIYTYDRRCKICGNRWMTTIKLGDIDESTIPKELVGREDKIQDILMCVNCQFVSFAVDNCENCDKVH